MKKIFLLFCCLTLTLFASCKQIPKSNSYPNIESQVAAKLMELDENYSDETLEAMSVVLRTNLIVNHSNENLVCDNEKYLKIANETSNLVLKNNNGSLVEISFENTDDYLWQKSIKKSELLDFAFKNNISLTNLSKINPVTKNEKIIGLEIGNKYFDYNALAQEFGLESNTILKISQDKNSIIVSGKTKGFYGYFDTTKSEQLSNNNYFFKDILTDFFDNLTINKI